MAFWQKEHGAQLGGRLTTDTDPPPGHLTVQMRSLPQSPAPSRPHLVRLQLPQGAAWL